MFYKGNIDIRFTAARIVHYSNGAILCNRLFYKRNIDIRFTAARIVHYSNGAVLCNRLFYKMNIDIRFTEVSIIYITAMDQYNVTDCSTIWKLTSGSLQYVYITAMEQYSVAVFYNRNIDIRFTAVSIIHYSNGAT